MLKILRQVGSGDLLVTHNDQVIGTLTGYPKDMPIDEVTKKALDDIERNGCFKVCPACGQRHPKQ